ncbi:Hypothetical protein CM240_1146 [Clostridium bornimense]|uniref:ESAT-6-like protein n=1 Tax=Clostridium bornimense TaxID=1216932 RepID=W6SF23_9CLOT|nr:WXG100 family type VII secretion target [Clostridium bornimense]CDM68310.1 Hypothetical protein CM240_1146 [Clostridium bornimense]
MSVIKVTPEELERCANAFKNAGDTTDSVINDLDVQIDMLLSSWEGGSRNSFLLQYEELRPQIKKFVELTHSIEYKLRNVSEMMQDTDEKMANRFR